MIDWKRKFFQRPTGVMEATKCKPSSLNLLLAMCSSSTSSYRKKEEKAFTFYSRAGIQMLLGLDVTHRSFSSPALLPSFHLQ